MRAQLSGQSGPGEGSVACAQRGHPDGRLLPELTRAEARRAEPASPRPQTRPEGPGAEPDEGPKPSWTPGHTRGGGPSSQALKDAACWLTLSEGRESSLLFTSAASSRAASSAAPRPFSIQRQLGQPLPSRARSRTSLQRPPTPPHCPSPSGPGPALGTALGPPESKPGRWVPGRPAARSPGWRGARGGAEPRVARSPGPEQGAGRPWLWAGGLALTCQRGRTRVPWPRSRTRCQGQQGWAQRLGLD